MKWKDLPTLGYTHFQPAQLTTVGKRATLWAQDLVIDLEEIEHRIATLRFRGVKGTTGTQASFLALFDGDHAKVRSARSDGDANGSASRESFAVTGQTYPRKVDAQIVSSLAGVAASVHKFCNDIRLLAGMKQIEEPFEDEQVGSSAMAYKRNPMRCERATGLARFVISLVQNRRCRPPPSSGSSGRWTILRNKRLSIPEAFLAIDGCLLIVINVARGLVVYPRRSRRAVSAELPFMATEEILMAAVRPAATGRHCTSAIRQHSQAAAEQVKMHGKPNDLIDRLRTDPAFAKVDLSADDGSNAIYRTCRRADRSIRQRTPG